MFGFSDYLSLKPPAQTFRLVEKARERDEQMARRQIVQMLELDPVTTVHLLRQVNSPVYALRQHVASLDRAVTLLGFEAISNAVFVETLGRETLDLSSGRAERAYAYLIRTGVAASFIAGALARDLLPDRLGVIQTGALIHQLGRMARLSAHGDRYLSIWKDAYASGGTKVALPPGTVREVAYFHTDYARHGEWIAKSWNFPSVLCEAIRHHGDPERADPGNRDSVRLVGVSQLAARTLFEPEDYPARDPARKRMEASASELARSFDVPRRPLRRTLEDATEAAYHRVLSIDL